MIFFI